MTVYDATSIEAAAKVAWEALFPTNPQSDWTEYARIKSDCAHTVRNAIRALPVSPVPTHSDAIGETVEKLREAICKAADFLDAAAGEDIEIDGMAAIGIVEDLHNLLPDDGRDRCFHEAVRLHLPTLLTALEQRGDGWLPIESAPKDGREILMAYGCGAGDDIPPPLVVCWDAIEAGWLAVGLDQHIETPPSHWRPLPTPPLPMKED